MCFKLLIIKGYADGGFTLLLMILLIIRRGSVFFVLEIDPYSVKTTNLQQEMYKCYNKEYSRVKTVTHMIEMKLITLIASDTDCNQDY